MWGAWAILPSVACPGLHYFSTLYNLRQDFRKKLLNVKRVFWFYVQGFFETFLTLKERSHMWLKLYIGLHVIYPFLSHFNETWIFATENTQILNFLNICPAGAELFHEDRRTVMTKLIVAFRSFTKAPKRPRIFALHWIVYSVFERRTSVSIANQNK
jgi:hypothetical protein